jgi:phosphoribosyl 1,2-cyclic phosphodiesterase
MALVFQSLRSSSSGNCLLLHSDRTTIAIDCGIRTQRECHTLLDPHAARLDAVLVSHAHGDHICYSSLRVLQKYGTQIHCHEEVSRHVHHQHVGDWDSPPAIRTFQDATFRVGEFEIDAVPLPHEPACPTFGFVIRIGGKKIVICTDFYDPEAIRPHLAEADFIFVEANHDLELLRQYPNYASRFHLSNRKTARLLTDARRASGRPPGHVMLGHLSEQRNSDPMPMQTVRDSFYKENLTHDFTLETAPRRTPSRQIHLD